MRYGSYHNVQVILRNKRDCVLQALILNGKLHNFDAVSVEKNLFTAMNQAL